ncbi:hypothetical protein AA313_de0204689 [Arthrobotrys entomopaga]|nr:hypothetical protein AA313_de0204689 [Arthrobotrys entomopaga]
MKDWFESADIQNGLHGSDHCPVYAVLKPEIEVDGERRVLLDLVNPIGVFVGGEKALDPPPPPKMSARLIPQFSGRRSIKDMFQTKTPSTSMAKPTISDTITQLIVDSNKKGGTMQETAFEDTTSSSSRISKRALDSQSTFDVLEVPGISSQPSPKKTKITGIGSSGRRNNSNSTVVGNGSQQSLKSFFQPKISKVAQSESSKPNEVTPDNDTPSTASSRARDTSPLDQDVISKEEKFIDPFETRDSWNKLFTKRPAPLCDGHNEPAKMMQTKKPGVNNGRSFWMCAR